jgi:hypothetical protein
VVQVLLRIAVWVLVLGIGYLLFGPGLFDSSGGSSPFERDAVLFLPPPRSQRLVALDRVRRERVLDPGEVAEYRLLVEQRQSAFWQRDGLSVAQALSGVSTDRRAELLRLLEQRGATSEEAAVFLLVAERDHPDLLRDRD